MALHRGLKRRLPDDDEDDDEEQSPQSPATSHGHGVEYAGGSEDEDSETSVPSSKRLIFVSVTVDAPMPKTTGRSKANRPKNHSTTTTLRFALSEDVVLASSYYRRKLQAAQRKITSAGRFMITDEYTREEECITQAIEYLMGTPLEELDMMGTYSKIVSFYHLGNDLEIPKLEQAIVEHVASFENWGTSEFAMFATMCFQESKNGTVLSIDSFLGQFIKTKMAELFPELDKAGCVDSMQQAGGPLSTLLLGVVREQLRAAQEAVAQSKQEATKREDQD